MKTCPKCGGIGLVADPKEEGSKMQGLRIGQGISQRQLAKMIGFSAMYVCDLERGHRGWNAELRQKYLDALMKCNTPK